VRATNDKQGLLLTVNLDSNVTQTTCDTRMPNSRRVRHNQQTNVHFKHAPCHANSELSKQQGTPRTLTCTPQIQPTSQCRLGIGATYVQHAYRAWSNHYTHHKHSHRPAVVTLTSILCTRFSNDAQRSVHKLYNRHPHRMFIQLPRGNITIRIAHLASLGRRHRKLMSAPLTSYLDAAANGHAFSSQSITM
jgi:hypothetical protein